MAKQTPVEKIFEAWTAVADGRVHLADGSDADSGSATVESSDGKKNYKVTWRDQGTVFTSTDPATFWQGYPGYPVIAVMMLTGRLPYDEEMARQFSGINWTELNASYKRDYAEALRHVEKERGINELQAAVAANLAYETLLAAPPAIRRK